MVYVINKMNEIISEWEAKVRANDARGTPDRTPGGRVRCKGNTIVGPAILRYGDYIQSKNCKFHAIYERIPNPPHVYPNQSAYIFRLVIKGIGPDRVIGSVEWPGPSGSLSAPTMQLRQDSRTTFDGIPYEFNGTLVIGGGLSHVWWSNTWMSAIVPYATASRVVLDNDGVLRSYVTLAGEETRLWTSDDTGGEDIPEDD